MRLEFPRFDVFLRLEHEVRRAALCGEAHNPFAIGGNAKRNHSLDAGLLGKGGYRGAEALQTLGSDSFFCCAAEGKTTNSIPAATSRRSVRISSSLRSLRDRKFWVLQRLLPHGLATVEASIHFSGRQCRIPSRTVEAPKACN